MTELAGAALLDAFRSMSPDAFWRSGIGHALRRTTHPKATVRLVELAKLWAGDPDRFAMVIWILARRPRSPLVAAFAETLEDASAAALLLFAHSDDHALATVI